MNQVIRLARTTIVSIAIAGVLIVGGIALYNHFKQPKLVITAPIGSTVSIVTAQTGTTSSRQTVSVSPITLSLEAGDYSVIAEQGGTKTMAYTTAKLFKTTRVTVSNPAQPLPNTILTHQVAFNPIVSQGLIVYYNTTNRRIEATEANGATVVLYPDSLTEADSPCGKCVFIPQAFAAIADNRAIVEFNNTFYILDGTTFTPLATDGLPPSSQWTQATLGATTTQSSFVLAIDKTIYRYASPNARPQKVMTLDKTFDQLSIGGDTILAYSTRVPFATEDITGRYNNFAVDPIIADLSAKTQKVLTVGPTIYAAVAPDGTRAIIQPQKSRGLRLYDLAATTLLYTAPTSGTNPIWTDTDHYVYTIGTEVWQADAATHSATTLSALPTNTSPTSITYDRAAASYYVSSYLSDSDASIIKIGSN